MYTTYLLCTILFKEMETLQDRLQGASTHDLLQGLPVEAIDLGLIRSVNLGALATVQLSIVHSTSTTSYPLLTRL